MTRLITFACLLVLGMSAASAQEFREGVHYQRIEPAQPTDDPTSVEVVEAFSYACPHCSSFQPFIHSWVERAPDRVSFRRLPIVFRASWEPFARAYYTLEAMDALDDGHEALFDALHKERARLRSNEDIAAFLAERVGIDADAYLKTARSFGIETRLRRGISQAERFGIDATPSIVVNGKYRATANMAGSVDRLLALIDYLVAQEAAGLPAGDEASGAASAE